MIMQKIWILALAVALVSCGGEKEEKSGEGAGKTTVEKGQRPDADQLLSELDELGKQKLDRRTVDQILSKAVLFSETYPEDDRVPGVLSQAAAVADDFAQMAEQSGNPRAGYFHKSVELCNRIVNKYPDSRDVIVALQRKATILDFNLKDDSAAVKVYRQLIEMYPNDTFNVSEWHMRIEHIGENPLDMILGQEASN